MCCGCMCAVVGVCVKKQESSVNTNMQDKDKEIARLSSELALAQANEREVLRQLQRSREKEVRVLLL